MQELINNATPTMTSLEIVRLINGEREEGQAELRHADFLVKVPKVIGEEPAKNFVGQYKAGNGQMQPCYNLPKREAHLMVMSESYKVQAKVYDRWQELEAVSAPVPTVAEALHHATGLLLEQDKRQRAIEARQDVTDDRVRRLEAKQQAYEDGAQYFTVLGFAVWKALPPIDLKSAAKIGKIATKLSKDANIPIDRVKDPRFGAVNSYHESMLDKAIEQFMCED
jgi:phage regulator Rha-like protein